MSVVVLQIEQLRHWRQEDDVADDHADLADDGQMQLSVFQVERTEFLLDNPHAIIVRLVCGILTYPRCRPVCSTFSTAT